jgi:hypothetical protein
MEGITIGERSSTGELCDQYLGVNNNNNTDVHVLIMDHNQQRRIETKRLERLITLAMELSHPNLLRYYKWFKNEHQIGIVIEYAKV